MRRSFDCWSNTIYRSLITRLYQLNRNTIGKTKLCFETSIFLSLSFNTALPNVYQLAGNDLLFILTQKKKKILRKSSIFEFTSFVVKRSRICIKWTLYLKFIISLPPNCRFTRYKLALIRRFPSGNQSRFNQHSNLKIPTDEKSV